MPRKLKQDRWITFPEDTDVQLKIRPFSIVYLKTPPVQENSMSHLKSMLDVWVGCVLDWKGIIGPDDKPLECNDTNRRLIGEQNMDLMGFVYTESLRTIEDVTEEEIKN